MEILNSPIVFLVPVLVLILGSLYIYKRARKEEK
jgi:hypothetical protein